LSIPSSSHYYLSKTEFRFPLAKNSNFWGTLFYDGGSVQIQSGPDLDPWRHAIGLGLRYVTPLGPLFNIEIAYKLDRKSEFDESAAQIHLSVASF
jgi:outer membrane translocation and assembly module TamA